MNEAKTIRQLKISNANLFADMLLRFDQMHPADQTEIRCAAGTCRDDNCSGEDQREALEFIVEKMFEDQ